MTIASVREGLADRLRTLDGITVYPEPPLAITACPCAILDWDDDAADYVRPGNTTHWRFRVLLLVAEHFPDKAYESLDRYIDKTGDQSVKAALEGCTAADWVHVTSCRAPGKITAMNTEFYGCEFKLTAAETNT